MQVNTDLQEILKLGQLTEEDISKAVTEEDLDRIATVDFRGLCSHLRMEDVDRHDADCEAKEEAGKRSAFFRKWKKMKGSNATYKKLIIAHLRTKNRNDAEKIAGLLKDTLATADKTKSACPEQNKGM